MDIEALLDGPAVDPRPAELVMLTSIADSLTTVQSQIATLQAREAMLFVAAQDVAELQARRSAGSTRERDIPFRAAAAELGAALRMSDRAVQARMSAAWTLTMRFMLTFAALSEGRITRAHATVIVEAGTIIEDDDARRTYEKSAIALAEIETPARLRELVRTIADRAEPQSPAERHRTARRTRGVFVRDQVDGMSELLVVGPSVLVHGIHDRITQMAHVVRRGTDASSDASTDAAVEPTEHDDRTIDQLRADILADIVLGGAPVAAGDGLDAIRAHVQVTVPVLTLAGVRGDGADLAGTGPIDPDTARRLAGGAPGWDRVMTHPVTGAVLCVDTYRPSAALRRTLRVRDEHCRFPGCREPVWRCDVDHSFDAALGGKTKHDNLAHLCRRHHTIKHAAGWRIRHLGGGRLEWTSPGGRTYIDTPAPTLRFMPVDADGALPGAAPPGEASRGGAPPDDPPPF